ASRGAICRIERAASPENVVSNARRRQSRPPSSAAGVARDGNKKKISNRGGWVYNQRNSWVSLSGVRKTVGGFLQWAPREGSGSGRSWVSSAARRSSKNEEREKI